jgi:hypothetical protein
MGVSSSRWCLDQQSSRPMLAACCISCPARLLLHCCRSSSARPPHLLVSPICSSVSLSCPIACLPGETGRDFRRHAGSAIQRRPHRHPNTHIRSPPPAPVYALRLLPSPAPWRASRPAAPLWPACLISTPFATFQAWVGHPVQSPPLPPTPRVLSFPFPQCQRHPCCCFFDCFSGCGQSQLPQTAVPCPSAAALLFQPAAKHNILTPWRLPPVPPFCGSRLAPFGAAAGAPAPSQAQQPKAAAAAGQHTENPVSACRRAPLCPSRLSCFV